MNHILESNIINSFRGVRKDIEELKKEVEFLKDENRELKHTINGTKDDTDELSEELDELKSTENSNKHIKYVDRCVSKEFVASEDGKKFHIPECPFAKNIHPNTKVTFKSKTTALNAGYKPCKCIEKY